MDIYRLGLPKAVFYTWEALVLPPSSGFTLARGERLMLRLIALSLTLLRLLCHLPSRSEFDTNTMSCVSVGSVRFTTLGRAAVEREEYSNYQMQEQERNIAVSSSR